MSLPLFEQKMRELLGQPEPRVKRCRHGSYYTEGRADNGNELLRCSKCSALFEYDGVRKIRV